MLLGSETGLIHNFTRLRQFRWDLLYAYYLAEVLFSLLNIIVHTTCRIVKFLLLNRELYCTLCCKWQEYAFERKKCRNNCR